MTGLVGAADFALQSGRTLWQAGHEFRDGDTEEAKRLLKRAWTEARPLRSFVDFKDWAIKVLDLQELPAHAKAMARKELMRLESAHA